MSQWGCPPRQVVFIALSLPSRWHHLGVSMSCGAACLHLRSRLSPKSSNASPTRMTPLFTKIDCHCLPVSDLEAALSFYRDKLGHEVVWRDASAVGLKLPDSNAELVLHIEGRAIETDLFVESVPAAIDRFLKAGGTLVAGPFKIRIGLCAVLQDQWKNQLIILDSSAGHLQTDSRGTVIEPSGQRQQGGV